MIIHILERQPPEEQGEDLPNLFHLYHGLLYARWFAISAFFNIPLIGLSDFWLEPRWHIPTWPEGDQLLLGGGLFAFFLLSSIGIFLVSYCFFEAQPDLSVRHKRSRMLNLEGLHGLLGFCGVLVVLIGMYDWQQKTLRTIPIALGVMFLFLVVLVIFNKQLRRKEEIAFHDQYLPFLSTRYLFLRLLGEKAYLRARSNDREVRIFQ